MKPENAIRRRLPICRRFKNGSVNRRYFRVYVKTAVAISVALSVSYGEADKERSKSRTKDESVYAELAKAPKKARDRQNPLKSDPEAAAAGAKLFAQHCAECHGEMAEGGRKAPNLLADEVQQASPGTLFWILTNGVVRRGMPVWSKLPEPQRWQLVSYIESLSLPGAAPGGPPQKAEPKR